MMVETTIPRIMVSLASSSLMEYSYMALTPPHQMSGHSFLDLFDPRTIILPGFLGMDVHRRIRTVMEILQQQLCLRRVDIDQPDEDALFPLDQLSDLVKDLIEGGVYTKAHVDDSFLRHAKLHHLLCDLCLIRPKGDPIVEIQIQRGDV